MDSETVTRTAETAGASIGRELPNLNRAVEIDDAEIEAVMTYHPWDTVKIEKGQKIRDVLGVALKVIIENVPPSADRSAAIRKLRDCRMDCNSAITHDGAF